ncbi:DNA repair metallo-beta-lactamase-domain-containing protein [Lactarius hengduanensis]|nr:DNA repair metallo-beta-lactamase-domain-containing protein [Lactarius hengduanensis]
MTAVRSKRKVKVHAESCSDVEVVETDAQQTHVASSSRKQEKIEHGARFVGSGQDYSFRQKTTQHSAGGEQPSATGSSFPQDKSSVPTSAPLLAADLGVSARSAIVASDSDTHISATTPSSCLDNLIKTDDEWSTGDDELVEDEPLSASGDNTLDQCPFCGRSLTCLAPLDIQSHINDCCDSSSHSAPEPGPLVSPHNPSTAPPQSKCEEPADCNAFSVLMSSRKENEAWKEADMAGDRSFRPTKANGGRRKAPFYKVMQGMPIAVDAFCYGAIPGVTSYFLTHAHSDHYTSLSSTWQAGPIYCSEGTANLIIHTLSVDPKWVHPLPMDVPTMVPNSGGVTVTLIEANHWFSLFFFEGPQTVNAGDSTYRSSHVGSATTFRYLHCGDFRASPQHTLHPAVKDKRIDIIYLDTTYLNPRYLFPAQAQVISACAELSKRLVSGKGSAEDDKGTVSKWLTLIPKLEAKGDVKLANTLILVGTYSIGKERIVKGLIHTWGVGTPVLAIPSSYREALLDSKIYCDQRKATIIRCQSDLELHEMLTADSFSTNVHIVPLIVAASDRLKEYMGRWNGHWTKAVAFRPTGWTPPASTRRRPLPPPSRDYRTASSHTRISGSCGSTPITQLFGVPYSEHSSSFELTCFVLSLDCVRIVPTVNVESAASRAKISTRITRWEAERRKRPPGVVPSYRTPEYW